MTNQSLVIEVITALARADGCDPLDLQYSLADHVDPELIKRLEAEDGTSTEVHFQVPVHEVVVTSDAEIRIDGVGYDPDQSEMMGMGESLSDFAFDLGDHQPTFGVGTAEPIEPMIVAGSGSVPELCFILDEDGIYRDLMIRPGTESLLFASAEELQGEAVTEMLPGDVGETILEQVRTTLDRAESHTFSYELPLEDGTHRFAARTHEMSTTAHGRIVLLAVRDMTESWIKSKSVQN